MVCPLFVTPRFSDAQILVVSTTVDAKKEVPSSISNLGSEHQNKPLAYKVISLLLWKQRAIFLIVSEGGHFKYPTKW